jgi:hypothetical protein
LLFFKLRFNATNDTKWMQAYGFWVKVFALTFALGVVSGITMSFQFGTNWPGFMETVGNIAGRPSYARTDHIQRLAPRHFCGHHGPCDLGLRGAGWL